MHFISAQKGVTAFFAFQSLRADAYDHYSAIYSLLCDRLKRHKNLRIAPSPSVPRTIPFPTSASIQVQPLPSAPPALPGQPVPYLLNSHLFVGVHTLAGVSEHSSPENSLGCPNPEGGNSLCIG